MEIEVVDLITGEIVMVYKTLTPPSIRGFIRDKKTGRRWQVMELESVVGDGVCGNFRAIVLEEVKVVVTSHQSGQS